MARKYAVWDGIIGDTSYHDTADEAITYAVAMVSSAYVSLGFDRMDASAWEDGVTWIWGGWNDHPHMVQLAEIDELRVRLPDIPSFAEHLSPDPRQWVSKLAASRDEWRTAA